MAAQRCPLLGLHEFAEAAPARLGRREAEQRGELAVGVGDAAVGVDRADALDRGVDDAAVALLGAAPAGQRPFALGDVAVGRHEAAVGRRVAADLDDRPVGPAAAQQVGLESAREFHPRVHQRVDVARPVLAALCVVADEGLEGRALAGHRLGEIEQLEEPAVPRGEPQFGIHDAEAHRQAIQTVLECGPANQVVLVDVHGCRRGKRAL